MKDFLKMWIISFFILFLLDIVIVWLLLGNYTYSILASVLKPIRQTPYWPLIATDLINAGLLLYLLRKTGSTKAVLKQTFVIGLVLGLAINIYYQLLNFAVIQGWEPLHAAISLVAGTSVYALSAIAIVSAEAALNKKVK